MSNSDNPFAAPTTVAEPVVKSAGPKRGVAHIVRRDKAGSKTPEPDAGKATAIGSANIGSANVDSANVGSAKMGTVKPGMAHVISRDLPPAFGDDSIDQLITSPALKSPEDPEETTAPEAMGKRASGGKQRQPFVKTGQLGTGSMDDLTVEEARPKKKSKVQISAKDAASVAPPEDPNRGFLAVRSGSDLGRRVGLLEGRTVIGRGLECDIVLTDSTVSRKHAYVERRENVYVVCDLDSGNGTFVNERERRDEVLIVNGDSFRIGNTVICFEGPEAQDDAGPAASDWDAPAVRGKKKGRRRQITNDEESTVVGKGPSRKSPPTHLDEADPVTQAPTGVVEGPQIVKSPPPRQIKRKTTVPPPIPEDKKSVQAAAIAALSSIVNTPTPEPEDVNATGIGELPNQTVPPTPSPAILYPLHGPNPAPPAQQMNSRQPPPPGGQGMQMRQGQGATPPRPGYPPAPGPKLPGPQMGMRQGGSGPMGQGAPPPMGAYGQHGSGPQITQPLNPNMQRPMLAGAAPNMVHGGYSAARPPARENGKLLIGFISVTLVLVVVGLLATVIGQMDDTKKGEGKEPAIAVENKDKDPGAETKDPAAETKDPGAETKDPAAETKDPAAETKETGENGNDTLLLASLTAGKTTLGASAWGTDESFLNTLSDLKPVVEPIEEPEDKPELPEEKPEDPEEKPETPKIKTETTTKTKPPRDRNAIEKRERERIAKRERDRERTAKRERERIAKRERDRERAAKRDRDRKSSDTPKAASAAIRTARAQALSMYKQQKFEAASRRLVKAADTLDDDGNTGKLYDTAEAYQDVGVAFARAEKKANQGNPGGALKDYKKAQAKDSKFAKKALGILIQLRIRQIAPKAAASYMSSGDYSNAEKAANDAKRAGAGSSVERIFSSLESKARKLIKKGLRAKKSGDDDKAKALFKEAIEVAPRKSEEESRARSELKRL